MGTPRNSALTTFEVASKSVAIIGGIISAIAIVLTLRAATTQRRIELQWRQSNLAMELLDSMWSDPQALDALRMIDWDARTYRITKGQERLIDSAEVESSLDVENNDDLSPSGVYVRESFDRLFYHMGRIERSVRTDLIVFDDVRAPFDYYVPMMRSWYGRVLIPYMRQLGHKDAIALLDRIPIADAPLAVDAPTMTGRRVRTEQVTRAARGRRLHVGNLPFSTTQDTIRDLFSAHGEVTEVSLVTDRETGRPRGFGFVEMGSREHADAAIRELNGYELEGRELRVSEAQERSPGGARPRGRSRRGAGRRRQ